MNFSNHSSDLWRDEQRAAAAEYGRIVDYPFPAVAPDADEYAIERMADAIAADIIKKQPDVVLCQGEFTLAIAIIERLKAEGIRVLAACSERCSEELRLPDGSVEKRQIYRFVRFRQY